MQLKASAVLAQLGEFEVVTSDLVLNEVERFFRDNFSRQAGYVSRRFVEELSTRIVRREEISNPSGKPPRK